MKLLAVRLARSIWLVPTYFLNPKGIFTRPIIEAMKIRYNFLKTPLDNPFPKPDEGYKYENGSFTGKNGTVIIGSVTIHNDGIVVDTRSSTDDGDEFLEEVLNWGSQEYGLAPYATLPIRKIYTSELNVVFERAPVFLNPKLAPFLDQVSSAIGDDKIGKMDFLALYLSLDQTRAKTPAMFRIDREVNVPFEENRFYSFAPTKTDAHIKLLEKLEQLAT